MQQQNIDVCNLRILPRRLILVTRGYYRSNFPRCLWSSRDYTSLLVPGHDPPKDLTVFMDVALNPGPSSSGNSVNAPPVLDDQHGDFDPVIAVNLPSKGLKIMHLNVRSIGNKRELIKILLLKRSIDILALKRGLMKHGTISNLLFLVTTSFVKTDHQIFKLGPA